MKAVCRESLITPTLPVYVGYSSSDSSLEQESQLQRSALQSHAQLHVAIVVLIDIRITVWEQSVGSH